MLTERNLRELLEFKPQHPVLSIYLNTEPSQGNADVYKLKLRSMLKDVALPEDVEAIETYFEHEYEGAGRSVASADGRSCRPTASFILVSTTPSAGLHSCLARRVSRDHSIARAVGRRETHAPVHLLCVHGRAHLGHDAGSAVCLRADRDL